MVVASGMPVAPGSMPANARYTGISCKASRARLVGEREPLLQEVDPQEHQDRVRWPAGGPRRGERGNPGDEGVPRDDGEHLLEEGLPARALGGSFETVRQTQLVHATMIPGQAPAPLPFAVNP